ncbi:hypothetical protein [Sphingobacterium sp.]|uniref:hypothetical protein n=1 Tax=Sphingobacterium sp. TaxID=341027 RepID=UPI00289BE0C3|nr:hypothetical protein [Sphingobacterium sp.]
MTPKEKANELVERFFNDYDAEIVGCDHAQIAAIDNSKIAAEEIISELESIGINSNYWQSVLKELNQF